MPVYREVGASTLYEGVCGATDVSVTEPRDYGHLLVAWKKEPRKNKID